MSLFEYVHTRLQCDEPGCTRTYTSVLPAVREVTGRAQRQAAPYRQFKKDAAKAGWRVNMKMLKDRAEVPHEAYCPEHFKFSRCEVCDRKIRPWGTTAAAYPEHITVAPGNKGRCQSCTGPVAEMALATATAKVEQAVEQYVRHRSIPFITLWQSDEDVRGDALALLVRYDALDVREVVGV